MKQMFKKIAILGIGWLGESLAIDLHQKGNLVSGSSSSISKTKELAKHPFYVSRIEVLPNEIKGDWDGFIDDVAYLIINIPPRRIENVATIYPSLIAQIADKTPKNVKVIFVSSTAVYGPSEIPISENVEATPIKESGVAVLAAEKVIQNHFGENATILRLAGLIGPNRDPREFLAGKKVLKNASAQVNLIHREDCIGLINAIIEQDCFGEVINGCASKHPVRANYYKNAAKILALDQPVFEVSEKISKKKIIDNSKSKELLNFTYKFDNPEQIFTNKSKGKISIIGAGPGNIKLLTLQAFDLIKDAEIILHDNLISEEILEINTSAERIYVGRKFGDKLCQMERQDTINILFNKYYYLGKKVVRIKSGDPYIYGRAGEEARYLTKEKIPFNVVPGISAALAAASYCNIPITERQKSNAVLICTAHTADYSFEQLKGIASLLKAGNSLALYMGLKSLDKLIPKLIEVTGNPNIPINAISNVSRENELLLSSTLGEIEIAIKENPLPMPVVFLIGVEPI